MSLWYSVSSGKKFCCFNRQEGWRLEPEDLANPDSPLIFKGVVFNEMKGAMVRGAYLCSVSEWGQYTCPVSEWGQYMCPVSEWGVHVSSEWVRCTCVQWVSEWGVHVFSEWVRCTCVHWVSEVYMCPVSEWFEKDWMVSLSV